MCPKLRCPGGIKKSPGFMSKARRENALGYTCNGGSGGLENRRVRVVRGDKEKRLCIAEMIMFLLTPGGHSAYAGDNRSKDEAKLFRAIKVFSECQILTGGTCGRGFEGGQVALCLQGDETTSAQGIDKSQR